MPTTNYYTVEDEILGQAVNESHLDYLPDALGSVITTVDQSGSVVHTARYKPYGADLLVTGPDTSFKWVGTLGYRKTELPFADQYVRARHYGSESGQWRNVDPLWPWESAYVYVKGGVCGRVDPSGLSVKALPGFEGKCKQEGKTDMFTEAKKACDALSAKDKGDLAREIVSCMSKSGSAPGIGGIARVLATLGYISDACSGGRTICVLCADENEPLGPNCPSPCPSNAQKTPPFAATVVPSPNPVPGGPIGKCTPYKGVPTFPGCSSLAPAGGCDCVVAMCNQSLAFPSQWGGIFVHELNHCSGLKGPDFGHGDYSTKDFVQSMGCCLCLAINPNANKLTCNLCP